MGTGQIYKFICTKLKSSVGCVTLGTFSKAIKSGKRKKGLAGFVPVKARWVIERSNSWRKRCKSLVKNFERTLAHATTKVNLCFVRVMLKRLVQDLRNDTNCRGKPPVVAPLSRQI